MKHYKIKKNKIERKNKPIIKIKMPLAKPNLPRIIIWH
jgi:hypothetical protein